MFSFFKKKKDEPKDTAVEKSVENFENVESVAKFFHEKTGVTFENQMSILKNKVVSFCRHRDIYSFTTLLNKMKNDLELEQDLIDHLTTNETFFYREFKQIEELVSLVKEKSTHVDILCAPCATGEEVYSIAIALLEAGVLPSQFNIVGIDINSDAIDKAQRAEYKERNVRKLSPELVSKYFLHKDEKYYLQESVKGLASLNVKNIFDNSFQNIGKFDFIFSRNMLIYFDKETKLKAKSILENLRKTDEHKVFFGHADLF